MSLPFVSCLCPTYGRPECVEEAIESFLRQDYRGAKELIVVNDLADQTLVCDHPDVRVINSKERITPLGGKFNAVAAMARGDVLFVWEDDDIYLPHRISYSIDRMRAGIWHTPIAWYEKDLGEVIPAQNLFHANLAIERSVFWSVGGYEESDWPGIDTRLFTALTRAYGSVHTMITHHEAYYVYRFGTSGRCHASTWINEGDTSARAERIAQDDLRTGRLTSGEIRLSPRWRRDYAGMVERARARL
jgi:glycosyltransferase involved in cell wall biosynthesis